jgi:hypothetical protein
VGGLWLVRLTCVVEFPRRSGLVQCVFQPRRSESEGGDLTPAAELPALRRASESGSEQEARP